ncbi:MAG: formate dehydrogenase accessory sulfurtransferase FdhD [Armatimonadetes bacterium]|nr:formate dehydrogenase accessory sulfurtransferase FdhD [Armatimonadota bacterium]
MTPTERTVTVTTVGGTTFAERTDAVAMEEPLEIRVRTASTEPVSVAITMRTPDADGELAAGFLWSEGIVTDAAQIVSVSEGGAVQPGGFANIVTLRLREMPPDISARQFYMTSSCGVCGKASLEAIASREPFPLRRGYPVWSPGVIHTLSDKLRAAQDTFDRTGGLHAAGLFDGEGVLVAVREDVGRHNAVDKIVGMALLSGELPLSDCLLFVSGRASFELVQKAVMAGVPALAAVGAPSSLAVALAKDAGVTLLGFVRGERFNIYANGDRIR